MKEKDSIKKFYLKPDKSDWLDLDCNGIILSYRTIVIKKSGSIRPKIIFDNDIYMKNILDVYPVFFENGLDIDDNIELIKYFDKKNHSIFRRKKIEEYLKKSKYLFKYDVDDSKNKDVIEENYHKIKSR